MDLSKDTLSTEEDIRYATDVLRQGGVILYPTDTVWGLGCDVNNEEAIKRIYNIKHRDRRNAMLVLIDSYTTLNKYVINVPDIVHAWICENNSMFLDRLGISSNRPITIIYPMVHNVSPLLLGGDESLGIRITKERFSNQLCKLFGAAIVSTSANKSGCPTPKNYTEINPSIIDSVDYVCRYRRDESIETQSSSIVKLIDDNSFEIIRK